MDLLANDLSIHRQFHTLSSFREAFARLMIMRNAARRLGQEVSCHRGFLTAKPGPNMDDATSAWAFHQKSTASRNGMVDPRRAVLGRSSPAWS